MINEMECIYCDTKFPVEAQCNYSVICPCCKRSIFLECEYGYGPVTPCQIYLGEKVVGIVESDRSDYFLNINSQKISLNQTYLEAIYEAEEVLKKHLSISHPCKDLQILTRGGSLCFYGNWFGRPYDNYHRIIETYFDDEILEIKFDHHERLLVYEPENITSTERELKIEQAKKIKWLYTPYNTNTYTTVTYTADQQKLFRQTNMGTEYLTITEPVFAVYLG